MQQRTIEAAQKALHSIVKVKQRVPFKGAELIVLFVLYMLPVILVVWLAEEVVEGEPLGFDKLAMLWIKQQHSPVLTTFFRIITEFGGLFLLGSITILVTLLYWLKKRRKAALFVATSVGGAALINLILKSIFQRDRPDFWQHLVQESGYSFPSGHAMASAAFAFSLIFLLWRTRFRWYAVVGGGVYLLLIGVSRMYLGVHYPTDIVTGWCVSFIWVSLVALMIYEYTAIKRSQSKEP